MQGVPIVPNPANVYRHLRDDHCVDKHRIGAWVDEQHQRHHAGGKADHIHAVEAERLADIEAAANLVASALGAADPATVDSICGHFIVDTRCTPCSRGDHGACVDQGREGDEVCTCQACLSEVEARWLSDYTRPPEPVDAVRDALLAGVEPMSVTGRALFILDALEAGQFDVTKTPAFPLTSEQVDYIGRWIEMYAIRPVGIPADGAPVESWEAIIINTLRTWGTRRRDAKLSTGPTSVDRPERAAADVAAPPAAPSEDEPPVIDLMAALEASLAAAREARQ
jgi:hypothetical protein